MDGEERERETCSERDREMVVVAGCGPDAALAPAFREFWTFLGGLTVSVSEDSR